MIYITTPAIDQQDGKSLTQYQGIADITVRTYRFKVEQDNVEISNEGSKDITVTLNGSPTTIKPGRSSMLSTVSEFTIVATAGQQYFSIQAWDNDGVTANGDAIAGGFKSNKVTAVAVSSSYDVLSKTISGKDYSAKLNPRFLSKKIAFLGSSTIFGQGATTGNSFFSLMNTALAAEGYTLYNRGIGGNTSQQAIDRFYTDIAPIMPDFVFIGLTMGNEGFHDAADETARRLVMNTLKANILQLVKMSQQNGIIPIVMSQMPTQRYDATHYRIARQLNADLDAMGIYSIDWMGAVLDPATLWPVASASADISHVNDSGHKALFKAVPLSMFDRMAFQPAGYITPPAGCINTGDLTVDVPLSFTPKYAIESFTVFLWFRIGTAPTGAVSLFSLGTSGGERIFTEGTGNLKWLTGGGASIEISAAASIATNTWYSLALTYNHISKRVDIYKDGVSIYSGTSANMTLFQTLYVGGRPAATTYPKNFDFKGIAVYRTKLIADRVKALHEGIIGQTSLEMYTPLHDQVTEAGTPMTNLAATTGTMYIKDTVTTFTHKA